MDARSRRERGSRPAGHRALAIEEGNVACPRRGVVDLDRCFRCRDYAGLEEGPVERLVCAASAGSELATPFGVIPA